jgi:uncharacterized repeat protein (TIGR01451 family)
VDAAGTQAADGPSSAPVFSPDGTKVAFASWAGNFGPTDTNGERDIYVRDLATGTTVLVSATEAGEAGSAFSSRVAFSPDGTKVAFASQGALLPDHEGSPDGGSWTDVFVRDLSAGTTALVSVDVTGTKVGNEASYAPVFSPDGSRIAFISRASDLGPTDANGFEDVYVRDLGTGTTTLVTAAAGGTGAGDRPTIATELQFSPDGTTLYFDSGATNLVTTPDPNGGSLDVFARNLATGATTLVTTNEAGTASANGQSWVPILSPDGTNLAFKSLADDLGPTDTNGFPDVYVRDLVTGTTMLASAEAGGGDSGNASSRPLSISADGTRVAFASYATDLGPPDGDSNEMPEPTGDDTGNEDIYVRDLNSGTTTMVSTDAAGTGSGNGSSRDAVLSPDGSGIAFVTEATDLGFTDRNEGPRGSLPDIYVASFHGADLSLTLEADPTTVLPGGTITYRVGVTNTGPDTSDAVVVGMLLPERSELVAVQSTELTCRSPDPAMPNALACDAGSLPPGAGAAATMTVTPTAAPATLSAVAVTTSETLDPDTSDNTASVDVTALDELP